MAEVDPRVAVVLVVVARGPDPEPPGRPVPRVLELGVNQHQLVGVDRAKGRVRPQVGRDEAAGQRQRYDDHGERVGDRPAVGVEQRRLSHPVVGFVDGAVQPTEPVLDPVGHVLQRVDDDQLGGDRQPVDRAVPAPVTGRQVGEAADQVDGQERQPLGRAEVAADGVAHAVRPRTANHAGGEPADEAAPAAVVDEDAGVTDRDRRQPEAEPHPRRLVGPEVAPQRCHHGHGDDRPGDPRGRPQRQPRRHDGGDRAVRGRPEATPETDGRNHLSTGGFNFFRGRRLAQMTPAHRLAARSTSAESPQQTRRPL